MAIRIGCITIPELRAVAGALRSELVGQQPDVSLHSYQTDYSLCTALLDGELELGLGYLAKLIITVGGQSGPEDVMAEQLASRAGEFDLAVAGMSRAMVAPMLVLAQQRAAELQIASVADLAAQAGALRLGGALPVAAELWQRLGFGEQLPPSFAEQLPLGPSGEFAARALEQGIVDVVISWNTEPVFASPGFAKLVGAPTAEQQRLVALVRAGDRASAAAIAAGTFLRRLTAARTAELLRATSAGTPASPSGWAGRSVVSGHG